MRRSIPCDAIPAEENLNLTLQCYTMGGVELTRVTVVDEAGTQVYDTLVCPVARVLDYNTQVCLLDGYGENSRPTSVVF